METIYIVQAVHWQNQLLETYYVGSDWLNSMNTYNRVTEKAVSGVTVSWNEYTSGKPTRTLTDTRK